MSETITERIQQQLSSVLRVEYSKVLLAKLVGGELLPLWFTLTV